MAYLTVSIETSEDEAVTLFRHHIKLALAAFELCPTDLRDQLEHDPVDSILNSAIVDFVAALDRTYGNMAGGSGD